MQRLYPAYPFQVWQYPQLISEGRRLSLSLLFPSSRQPLFYPWLAFLALAWRLQPADLSPSS